MKWFYTDGWELRDFNAYVEIDDDYELDAEEKKPFINVVATEASKTLVLGLGEGDTAFVSNIGDTNAVTIANVEDDTGTSLAYGKTVLIVASETADGSIVIALN